jgi:hypothetical protein
MFQVTLSTLYRMMRRFGSAEIEDQTTNDIIVGEMREWQEKIHRVMLGTITECKGGI